MTNFAWVYFQLLIHLVKEYICFVGGYIQHKLKYQNFFMTPYLSHVYQLTMITSWMTLSEERVTKVSTTVTGRQIVDRLTLISAKVKVYQEKGKNKSFSVEEQNIIHLVEGVVGIIFPPPTVMPAEYDKLFTFAHFKPGFSLEPQHINPDMLGEVEECIKFTISFFQGKCERKPFTAEDRDRVSKFKQLSTFTKEDRVGDGSTPAVGENSPKKNSRFPVGKVIKIVGVAGLTVLYFGAIGALIYLIQARPTLALRLGKPAYTAIVITVAIPVALGLLSLICIRQCYRGK